MFITSAIYRFLITNGTQESNRDRNSTERSTNRDSRTRSTTEGKEGRVSEKVSSGRGEKSTRTVRIAIRRGKESILCCKRCKTYIEERWTVTSVIPLYFSQFYHLLFGFTFDDYIMFDKLHLVLDCYLNQSLQACMRGVGM